MSLSRFWLKYLLTMLGIAFITVSVVAQSAPDRQILGIAKEDGQAYIYHAEKIPLSHGYNIFRSMDGDNWDQLNNEVIYPASDGYDLEYRLQEQFTVAQQLTGREDPQAVFLILRSSSGSGLIANFASPSIALEVGRLYIDEEAPIGESVYYRFEIVDDLGRTTEQSIEGEVDLEVIESPAPSDLEVENKGRTVDLSWEYVQNSVRSSRFVIRFQIFYRSTASEEWIPFNLEFLARTTETTEYQYTGEVPKLNEEYEFVVQAVDFTGSLSDESNLAELNVMENTPPDIVRNVNANDLGDYTSRVTWNVSTELDLDGYHVYRARDDQEEYDRITSEILSPLQTVYEDSATEPGHQYRYKITALDTLGNESELSNPGHIFMADERMPDPVTSLEATLVDNEVARISWENGEVPGDLRSYQILRREQGARSDGLWNMLNSSAYKDRFYEDTGVGGTRFVEGTTVEYGVAIVSDNGSISDTVITALKIPDITPPNAPDLLEAKMQEARRVGITWNASASSDVTHYRLYKREADRDTQSDSLLAEVRKGDRYFRDENVPLNKTYIYSLSAVDSVGNESDSMITDTLNTRATHAPQPVRNVQAVIMDEEVVLAWEPSDEEKIGGYVVYRSQIATGVYDQVGSVEVSTTRWTDTAGEAGVWYKVYAVDKTGRESRTAKATQAINRN